jgi:chloramphenicol-sensitive protein RarD
LDKKDALVTQAEPRLSGFPQAIAAYVMWGLLPLYLLLVLTVPPVEFLAWRILFTLPICLVLVAARRQIAEVVAALRSRKVLGRLALSACLIGVNWLVYLIAIMRGEVYGASLGYYINPLLNVLIGTFAFGETLTRRAWIAVALAACGVAVLAAGALSTLWISLTLACSFAGYGAVRKQLDVGSVPGLTVESALLSLPSALYLGWLWASGQPLSFGQDAGLSGAIALSGVVTAVPLLLFAIAARRLPYSTLGFVQFLAPTLVFILGLTVFRQKLHLAEIVCFAFIWSALAVFCLDLWLRRPKGVRRPVAS